MVIKISRKIIRILLRAVIMVGDWDNTESNIPTESNNFVNNLKFQFRYKLSRNKQETRTNIITRVLFVAACTYNIRILMQFCF